MLIDSHCHLNFFQKERDFFLEKIIASSKKIGVEKIISVSTTIKNSVISKNIANKFNNVFYSVGVHPNEIKELKEFDYQSIYSYKFDKKFVAIGETGLDYYSNPSKNICELQKAKFIDHIKIAHDFKKPVIIHSRSAKDDTLLILKKYSEIEKYGGVLHCFNEDWNMAKKIIDLGIYISISGIVTFKNALNLQEVAKKIPLDRLLVETDSPYLSPEPYRGKVNHPSNVYYVAKFLSNLRCEKFDKFCEKTKQNTKKLFSLV